MISPSPTAKRHRGRRLALTAAWPKPRRNGVPWLARYDDQGFSFADAVSFAVMTERGIRDALTLDHHFVVAGFHASA